MSKRGVISCPYFPVFGPEINPYLDTFHTVIKHLTVFGFDLRTCLYQKRIQKKIGQKDKERRGQCKCF